MCEPIKPGRTGLAPCIVSTIFLLFLVVVVLVIFFTVFKPQGPEISVNAVHLSSFSVFNPTVKFTFSQHVSIRNPNRAALSHYDSTLQLLYDGSQVGFMFIPAGEIEADRTQYVDTKLAVEPFPLSSLPAPAVNVDPAFGGYGKNFKCQVEAKTNCRVAIALDDGCILGFHC